MAKIGWIPCLLFVTLMKLSEGNLHDLVCPQTDVLYVVSGASSIGQENFDFIKERLSNQTVESFQEFGNKLQFGVVEYAENDFPFNVKINESTKFNIIELGQCSSASCVPETFDNLNYLDSANNHIQDGLERALQVEFKQSSYYDKAKRLLLLITNGPGDGSSGLPQWYADSQSEGVLTIAIGVGNSVNETELKIIANGGASSDRVYLADDFTDMPSIEDIIAIIKNAFCTKPTTQGMTESTPTGPNATPDANATEAAVETTTSGGRKRVETFVLLTVMLSLLQWVELS